MQEDKQYSALNTNLDTMPSKTNRIPLWLYVSIGVFVLVIGVVATLQIVKARVYSKATSHNTIIQNIIEISLQSKIDNINVSFTSLNKQAFLLFLNDIGLLKDNGVINIRTSDWIKVKKLTVILEEDITNPILQNNDQDNTILELLSIEYPSDSEVAIHVYRKDWDEMKVNILINNSLLRISSLTHKPFDAKLTDSENMQINRVFINVNQK